MSLSDELREYELVRDKYAILRLKKGDYSRRLSEKIGLPFITLTPDKDQICNFASMCYLFSLFNIKVSSFSAIPRGYVASFTRNGEFFGTFLTDPNYISQVIIGLCKELGSKFYQDVIKIMSCEGMNLTDKCLEISKLGKSEIVDGCIKEAIKKFNEVNTQNCRDNDTIIENIVSPDSDVMCDLIIINGVIAALKEDKIIEDLGSIIVSVVDRKKFSSEEERSTYIAKVAKAKKDFDDIFDNFIIQEGYYVYRGKGKEQNGKILNSRERIEELRQKLQEIKPNAKPKHIAADIIDIINMCATDYSADIVYDVLNCIANGETKKIDAVIPDNEGNQEEKLKFGRNRNPINERADHSGRNR